MDFHNPVWLAGESLALNQSNSCEITMVFVQSGILPLTVEL